jgi:GNAT superfamily N-acetyltransferase
MNDDLRIAPLDPADIEQVGPLWKQLMDHVAGLPGGLVPVRPSDESWVLERAEMLEELAGESFVLTASRDGRVAGYAFVCVEGPDPVWYTGDKHAMLATLCVDEEERGDGVGTALMDAVDAELERRGIEDVEIGVDTGNEVAAHLYESRGYRPDFRIFYGTPARRPWASLRREAEDEAAGRGRFATPGPDDTAATDGGSGAPSAAGPATIERLDPAHLDELQPLWEALLVRHAEVWTVLPERPAGDTWARRRRQYEDWLSDDGSFVLLARRDGRGVGYVLVGIEEGDETYVTGERMAEIHTLVVAAGERDAGVGGLLFDAAMEELGRLGVDDLLLGYMDGNEAAHRFYRRRGFVPFVHMLYARRPGADARGES